MKCSPYDTKEERKYVKMKIDQTLRLPKPRPLKEMLEYWKKTFDQWEENYKERGTDDR